MADVVCLGEALIDFVAMEPCSDVGLASGFIKAPGGAPANVAVGLARIGRSSAFLGKVGDDPFGRFIGRTLEESGVNISGLIFDTVHRTGLAFVSLAENGERDFCFFRNPSADMTYDVSELDLASIDNCQAFHFGSITLIDECPRAATLASVKKAKVAGKLISYDPNIRPPLWPSMSMAREVILMASIYPEVVKVSEEELAFLMTSASEMDILAPDESETTMYMQSFMDRFENVQLLAVTRGAKGCRWQTRSGQSGFVKGLKVEAVDTTGAGDGFVAGMLDGLLAANYGQNLPNELEEKVLASIFNEANKHGAFVTTQKGAIPAMPTREMLANFTQNLD